MVQFLSAGMEKPLALGPEEKRVLKWWEESPVWREDAFPHK
jgi:hypothetical protein